MKRLLLAFLGMMVLAAGGYARADSPANPAASSQTPSVRYQEVHVYCPTQVEEARQHYVRGVQLGHQGDLEGAMNAYRKALDLDPNYCDAMDNLGQLHRRQGKLDEAALWYKKSIKVLPTNPVPHQNLAVVYEFQGKIKDAISEYETLTGIDPENPEGYYGLGNIHVRLEQFEPALKNLKRAEELYVKSSSPFIMDAQKLLGIAYFRLRDFENAKHYFKACYDHFQKEPMINYAIGMTYILGNRDLDEARKYIRRARDLGLKLPDELVKELKL